METTKPGVNKIMNMNIHNVAKLDLSPIKTKDGFSVRTLVVTDADGKKFELMLFADVEEGLQIKA